MSFTSSSPPPLPEICELKLPFARVFLVAADSERLNGGCLSPGVLERIMEKVQPNKVILPCTADELSECLTPTVESGDLQKFGKAFYYFFRSADCFPLAHALNRFHFKSSQAAFSALTGHDLPAYKNMGVLTSFFDKSAFESEVVVPGFASWSWRMGRTNFRRCLSEKMEEKSFGVMEDQGEKKLLSEFRDFKNAEREKVKKMSDDGLHNLLDFLTKIDFESVNLYLNPDGSLRSESHEKSEVDPYTLKSWKVFADELYAKNYDLLPGELEAIVEKIWDISRKSACYADDESQGRSPVVLSFVPKRTVKKIEKILQLRTLEYEGALLNNDNMGSFQGNKSSFTFPSLPKIPPGAALSLWISSFSGLYFLSRQRHSRVMSRSVSLLGLGGLSACLLGVGAVTMMDSTIVKFSDKVKCYRERGLINYNIR